MYRRHNVVRAAVLATLALLLLPVSAHAAPPITFDALANNTVVDTEYVGDGVTFLNENTATGSTGFPLAQNVGATKANSGTNVAMSQCYACEFVHHVIKGRFATSQEAVSVRVGINSVSAVSIPIMLEARAFNGVLLDTTTVSVNSTNFRTLITVDPPGSDNVVYFRVRTVNGGDAGYQFAIDDVDAVDNGASAPDIGLSTTSSSVRIRQGGSVQLPIDVFRINGSNGNVSLSALSLPSGVTSGFMPNPVTGTSEGPSQLTLTAANTATIVNSDAFTIQGTPDDAFVGSGTSSIAGSITVEPAFTVSVPTPIRVPSCGSTTVNVSVTRAFSGFNDNINLAVSGLPAGYTGVLGSTVVGAPAGGSFVNSVPLTITRTGTGSMADTSVTVTGTSGALSSNDTSVVQRFAGEITGVTPAIATTPQNTAAGSNVTITGRGLCTGSSVRFNNSFATVTLNGGNTNADKTSATVQVPRLASTGPVKVTNADGAFDSPSALTIRSARNMEGFAFENYDHDGVGLSDLQYVYGEAQTNITLDLCWPFGCNVVTPIPSPLTGLYILISNGALSGNGSCYGIVLTSQQLALGRVPYSRFAPTGATNVLQLSNASAPASALRRHIRAWHSTQLSSEAIRDWVATAAANALTSGSGVRGQLESEMASGRNSLVMVNDGGGHAVIAHNVRTEGAGYRIDLYDPNLPFVATEDSDHNQHRDREDRSSIQVQPGGDWSFDGAFASTWHGSAGDLVQVPFTRIKNRPTMPTTLTGLLTLIVPLGEGSSTSGQVVDSKGNQLLNPDGTLNTNPASDIAGASVMPTLSGDDTRPVYLLPANGTYTQRMVGTKDGTTGAAIAGPGFAAHVTGIDTGAGKTEEVQFDAGDGDVNVDATEGGDLRARLARGNSKGDEFGADIKVSDAEGGDLQFGLNPRADGVHFENGDGGAAGILIGLSYANEDGTPGSLQMPKVTVPKGGSAGVDPASWSRLGAMGATLVVRDSRNRVVRRVSVRPAKPRWLRSAKVSAKTAKGKTRTVRVNVRYAKVPKGANVFVVVRVMKGKKLVAVRRLTVPSRRAKGARNYTFGVKLPRGTYAIRGAVGVVTTSPMRSHRMAAFTRFKAR